MRNAPNGLAYSNSRGMIEWRDTETRFPAKVIASILTLLPQLGDLVNG